MPMIKSKSISSKNRRCQARIRTEIYGTRQVSPFIGDTGVSIMDEIGTVYTLAKNNNEEVRMYIHNYKRKLYFSVRAYYKDGDKLLPTKKGLTLRLELLPEFVKGINQLAKEAKEAGHLESEEQKAA